MHRRTFWKTVTVDRSDMLDRLITLLRDRGIAFCVIGGQAVNAYVEPVVSLDLDLAISARDLPSVEPVLAREFHVERFAHSLNVSSHDSDLRVQIQLDPRYASFVSRAVERDILGVRLPVADVEDVLEGKVWAVEDADRRASKRQKDLADIARLLEAYPHLRAHVPDTVLKRLL